MHDHDDPHLSRMLGAASGPEPDSDVAYRSVLGRVKRARQRRAAAIVLGAGTACLVGLVAFSVSTNDEGRRLGPAEPITVDSSGASTTQVGTPGTVESADPSPGTTGPATSDLAGATTVPGVVDGTATSNGSVPGGGTTSVPTLPSNAATSPPPTQPPSTQPTATTAPTQPPATAAPTTTATTTPTAQSYSHTCAGGSATVRRSSDTLALTGVSPAPGYAHSGDDVDPDRIRVKFEADGASSEIEFEIAGADVVRSCNDSSSGND